MIIETKRLVIRPFTMDDVSDIHDLFVLPDVMRLVGMAPAHSSIRESEIRISRWIQHGLHHAVALKESGKVIGYIVIKPDSEEKREDTRELGFALKPEYQCRGYMTETVRAVVNQLKSEGVRFVWACCFVDNLPSRKLIERCGFEFQNNGAFFAEGELRTYQSLEYRIELSDKTD